MRCPKCGSENPEGRILCRTCGTRLRPGVSRSEPAVLHASDEELRRRVSFDLVRIAWVTAVVVAVGLGLGLLLK